MSHIQEYFEPFGADEKNEYERIKQIVLSIIPDAEETMSYGIPTFKYKGKNVIHFGAFKYHMSLFPGGIVEEYRDQLKGYVISKGTVQYHKDTLLPEALIREFVTRQRDKIDKKV